MKIIGRNFPLSFIKISGWSAFMKVNIIKEIKMDLCLKAFRLEGHPLPVLA